MHRLVATLALACLAGCAVTRAELERLPPTRVVGVTSNAATTANCIARNAENYAGALIAQVRYSGANAEVVVSLPTEAGPRASAQIDSANARIHIAPTVWPQTYADEFLDALVRGC